MPGERYLKKMICLTLLLYLISQVIIIKEGLSDEFVKGPLAIRVGAYENHPKIFTDINGSVIGIFPDILADIARKEGWQIAYVKGSWTECLERLMANELDMMVDVAFSDQRSREFDFNAETVLVNWGIIYTQKNMQLDSWLDLNDKAIAVMKGSIHTEGDGGIKNLAERFDIDCHFIEVETYEQVFELLSEKKVAAGAVNRIFGSLFEETYDVTPTSIIFNPRHLKFAFPKDSEKGPYLIERIDHHLKRLKKTPESIYHKALFVYLSNLPREWITNDPKGLKEKKVPLTEKEKEWIRNHPVIHLGVDPEFAPFEFVAENGRYQGIASDYIAILNERLGLNMQVVQGLPWRTVMEKARSKQIDMLPCVDITADRKTFLNYTKPYLAFHRVIITRIDMPLLSGMDDLYGIKVSVQQDSSNEGYLRENTTLNPILFETLQKSLLAVSDGTVDAFVGNIASSTYWIRQLNLTNLKVAAPVSQTTQNLYMAVRNDWPELVSILNKGLSSISTQESTEIRGNWVNVEYKLGIAPLLVRKYLLQTAGVALIMLTLIMVWNYGLKREIRTRREYEDKLQQANTRLQELDRLKSMFIASMSHELRTPLNSIIGFSSITLNEWIGPLNDEQKENVSTVLRSGKHLLSLINDVIDVSKIEAGKLDIFVQDFSFSELLREATALFSNDLKDKKLSFHVESLEMTLHTDRRRLLQAMVNTISNAIKYTEKGSIAIRAGGVSEEEMANNPDFQFQDNMTYIAITVTDTGIGISEEDMSKIFKPFVRLDTPLKSSIKGTGLGLYLTRKIVTEILNGTIILKSTPGKGTHMTIIIPETIIPNEKVSS
ncbi:MAG: transporter substrate-binding domain-containing protein [Proteobacteria bacterium]|nr:transporter substrate-binding domain-containing protein [Pseudomonadota bacterium]